MKNQRDFKEEIYSYPISGGVTGGFIGLLIWGSTQNGDSLVGIHILLGVICGYLALGCALLYELYRKSLE